MSAEPLACNPVGTRRAVTTFKQRHCNIKKQHFIDVETTFKRRYVSTGKVPAFNERSIRFQIFFMIFDFVTKQKAVYFYKYNTIVQYSGFLDYINIPF